MAPNRSPAKRAVVGGKKTAPAKKKRGTARKMDPQVAAKIKKERKKLQVDWEREKVAQKKRAEAAKKLGKPPPEEPHFELSVATRMGLGCPDDLAGCGRWTRNDEIRKRRGDPGRLEAIVRRNEARKKKYQETKGAPKKAPAASPLEVEQYNHFQLFLKAVADLKINERKFVILSPADKESGKSIDRAFIDLDINNDNDSDVLQDYVKLETVTSAVAPELAFSGGDVPLDVILSAVAPDLAVSGSNVSPAVVSSALAPDLADFGGDVSSADSPSAIAPYHDKNPHQTSLEATIDNNLPGEGVPLEATPFINAPDLVTNNGLRPLKPEEVAEADRFIHANHPDTKRIIVNGADSVTQGSLKTLRNGTWLNDEIISYFCKNSLAKRDEARCAKHPGQKRSHFFNSYFIQKMFDTENDNENLRDKYNYDNVKRWSKKVPGKDIFNLKYIFCPINIANAHWTLAVIFVEEKKIQYYDAMGCTDWATLEGLRQYLCDEYREKNGVEMDKSEWELVPCTRETPKQKNGYDCGVFVCAFVDVISRNLELNFTQRDINSCYYRKQIALAIMKAGR